MLKITKLIAIISVLSVTPAFVLADQWHTKVDFSNPPSAPVSIDVNSCKYRLTAEFRVGFNVSKVHFLPRQYRNIEGPVTILFSIDAAEARHLEELTRYSGPENFNIHNAFDNRDTVPQTIDLNFTNSVLLAGTKKLGITLDMSYSYTHGRPPEFDGYNPMSGFKYVVGQTSGGSHLLLEESCPPMAGDVNGDRSVDRKDAEIIMANLKQLPTFPIPISRSYISYMGKTREQGDLDGNGMVDSMDYYLWATAYSRTNAK